MSSKDDFDFYDKFYRTGRKIFAAFAAAKLNFKGEKIPIGIGPRFILCNHNTDYDFLLLANVSTEPMDYVATEAMLRMGPVPRLAADKLKVILHDKGSTGIGTLKEITGRIKKGRSVALFPEGNRSFDGRTGEVSSAIGKIAKMTGATIVLYRITGGYLTTPRWGHNIRRGRMSGSVVRILTTEELSGMSAKELQKVIEEGLYTDAYEEQKKDPIAFKSSKRAEYLETLLFTCPLCKKTGTLSSKGNRLSCGCGFEMTLDEYGYLTGREGRSFSVTEAFEEQKRLLADMLQGSLKESLWQDDVTLIKLGSDHSVLEEKSCSLTAYTEYLMIGDRRLERSDISSVDIVQRNRLSIHESGADWHYEFTGSRTYNAVKYLAWFERSLT